MFDALSTAIVMEEFDLVASMVTHVQKTDFTETKDSCSLFETTIRYLGGMLSAFDLLTGPYVPPRSYSWVPPTLLEQSRTLANTMKFAFDTKTGIPFNELNIEAQKPADAGDKNGIATIGSLILEWTRLTDITHDSLYARLAQRGESYLLHPEPAWAEPFPGLLGTTVNIDTGLFEDASGGWGGGTDSFYEYLIKMYIYDPDRFGGYRDRWVLAADSSMTYLASHPQPFPDLTYMSWFSNTTTGQSSSHLACFNGGNFILGGLVLDEQKYIDFGLNLTHGCRNTYTSTKTGLGPESFAWDASTVPDSSKDFYQKHGFYITDARYGLRPEYLESLYYAYRATGDTKYQEWA